MKLSNKLEPNDSTFFEVVLKLVKTLHPNGLHASEIPIKDQVGLLILVRMLNHFTDHEQILVLSILYTSMIGEASGLRAPKNGESYVTLLDQINN